MTFANRITLFRIISVPFFVGVLLYYTPERDYLRLVALGIFILAILSDVVDGYVARKAKQTTRTGSILDPLADKSLLISGFIVLYFVSRKFYDVPMPLWLVLAVISRDIIILFGAGAMLIYKQDVKVKPTQWGKLTTFFQMMSVVSVLAQWPLEYSQFLWLATFCFTLISGVDYTRKGIIVLGGNDASKKEEGAARL